MDSSITLPVMTLLMILVGSMNLLFPFVKKKKHSRTRLVSMITASVFYLGFIVMMGILYVKDGITSFTMINLGNFSLKFHIEALGMIFLSLIGSLWPIAILYTDIYLKKTDHPHPRRMFIFISLSVLITSLIALSANLMTMFIFYELLTLCTLPLVWNGDFHALEKYLRPLLYPAFLLFLPAILIVNNLADSNDFRCLGLLEESPVVLIILLLMFIFGIAKTALVPMHSWLPSAMVAIVPVSALLHAVAVVKAGLFCLLKIVIYTFGVKYLEQSIEFSFLFLLIPAATILYSGIKAFKEEEIKRILAYSTINQLATAVFSIFLFSKAGIAGAVMQMLAHSTAKIAAFFAAGNIYIFAKQSSIKMMEGLYYRMPITTALFALSMLSISGFPFLAGALSKKSIAYAVMESNNIIAIIIFFISSILTLLYSIRIVYFLFKKPSYAQQKIKESKVVIIPHAIAASTIIIFPLISFIALKFIEFIQ
ncbi:MAG: cation:proton antiporter [Rickettsiaceae bacterium]|nr:cation:proton antiporter [Rickettsiaceae bacterium]